jgi:hypothetical protein
MSRKIITVSSLAAAVVLLGLLALYGVTNENSQETLAQNAASAPAISITTPNVGDGGLLNQADRLRVTNVEVLYGRTHVTFENGLTVTVAGSVEHQGYIQAGNVLSIAYVETDGIPEVQTFRWNIVPPCPCREEIPT